MSPYLYGRRIGGLFPHLFRYRVATFIGINIRGEKGKRCVRRWRNSWENRRWQIKVKWIARRQLTKAFPFFLLACRRKAWVAARGVNWWCGMSLSSLLLVYFSSQINVSLKLIVWMNERRKLPFLLGSLKIIQDHHHTVDSDQAMKVGHGVALCFERWKTKQNKFSPIVNSWRWRDNLLVRPQCHSAFVEISRTIVIDKLRLCISCKGCLTKSESGATAWSVLVLYLWSKRAASIEVCLMPWITKSNPIELVVKLIRER